MHGLVRHRRYQRRQRHVAATPHLPLLRASMRHVHATPQGATASQNHRLLFRRAGACHRIDLAEMLHSQMLKDGITPDTQVLNSLIHTCAQVRQIWQQTLCRVQWQRASFIQHSSFKCMRLHCFWVLPCSWNVQCV